MLSNDFNKHEANKRVRWYLANREVLLHLIYPVLDIQVSTPYESFDLTLHATAGTTFGSTQHRTVDGELSILFRIDFLSTLAFVGVAIVRIVWGSTEGLT